MSAHPTARRLLSILADLAEDGGTERGSVLANVYGLEAGSGAPLDVAVIRWIAAGCPVNEPASRGERTRAAVVDAILFEPGITVAGIASALGLHERHIRWHVARLVASRVVRAPRRERSDYGPLHPTRATVRALRAA